MTTITLDPIVLERPAYARLSAKPVHGTFADARVFTFDRFSVATVQLDPPAINDAWVLALTIGGSTVTRTVIFTGDAVGWDDLIDVDPTTLTPVPVGDALAAWDAVRVQLDNYLEAHIMDTSPHPAYDDIPDLTILFENKVETGLIVDENLPDLTNVFNTNI